jgi:protocatechuate 3,4-dioxygenase beta subunit
VDATIGFLKTGAPITVQVQGPSAVPVPVTVSGRVTTAGGQGVSGARVYIFDSGSLLRTAVTSSFGYYSFDNITTGVTYTVGVQSKRYTFTQQVLQINNSLSNLDFVAQP